MWHSIKHSLITLLLSAIHFSMALTFEVGVLAFTFMRSTTSAPGFNAFATWERTVADPDDVIPEVFLDAIAAVEEDGAFQAFGSSPSSSSYVASQVPPS